MAVRRKSDPPVARSQFRTDRMLVDNGLWFFLTREGTIEGPFECQRDATDQLEVYIRLAMHDFIPKNETLSLGL